MTGEFFAVTLVIKSGGFYLKKLFGLLFIGILVISAVGCSDGGSSDSPVVAMVNGTELTREEFDSIVEYNVAYYESQGSQLSDEDLETIQELVLESMIDDYLLLDAADNAGFTPETVDVDGEIASLIEEQFEDESKFEEYIQDLGLNRDEYREQMARVLMIDEHLEAELELSQVEVSEDELNAAVDDFMESDDEMELEREYVEEYFASTLVEEKTNEMIYEYLEELRADSEIEYLL